MFALRVLIEKCREDQKLHCSFVELEKMRNWYHISSGRDACEGGGEHV